MLQLHVIADKEDGWIQVVSSMVKVIPMNDPLGPAVITLLLDDCPLPTKVSQQPCKHTIQVGTQKCCYDLNLCL